LLERALVFPLEKQRKDKKEERTEIVWANMPT
jgi:hypothetical protein